MAELQGGPPNNLHVNPTSFVGRQREIDGVKQLLGRTHLLTPTGAGGGRLVFQPGWRWSECIKPVVGTDSCQATHVGYAVSGRVTVRMNDGSQKTIAAGISYTIPPGHDAWVEGAEPFVCIEMMSAEQFAKR